MKDMLNVCVLACASRETGALTIYKQFIEGLKRNVGNDKYWIFIDPSMPQVEIENVTYITYNTVGLKRFEFDFKGLNRELEKRNIKIDVQVSFQNTGANGHFKQQIIYFHNPFSLYNLKFSPLKKENFTPIFYTNIYPLYVKKYLAKNAQIVVQAQFLKQAFSKRYGVDLKNIHVLQPDTPNIDTNSVNNYEYTGENFNFLYPATSFSYKNHSVIIKALDLIKQENKDIYNNIRIHFSLDNKNGKKQIELAKQLDVEEKITFHGAIPHTTLLEMYKSCTALLFPSKLETLGLPQTEAASFGKKIIVSNMDYAKEALNGYEGATYISPDNDNEWANEIVKACKEKQEFTPINIKKQSSWDIFFDVIHNFGTDVANNIV